MSIFFLKQKKRTPLVVTLHIFQILSTLWIIFGFSVSFGDSVGGFIGNPFQYPMLYGLKETVCLKQAPKIPGIIYALFQMMFACITPLLQTGSFAGRLQFRAFVVYIVLWEIIVYYPLVHWIWGNGWLSPYSHVLSGHAVYDFAGGIVIQTSSGVGGLICAIGLGPRLGFLQREKKFTPSNLGLASLGATLLWLGWFGFNGGNALTAGGTSALAIINTQIAASLSGCIWLAISWKRNKPSLVETLNGAIAGLAGITPVAGYFSVTSSAILGIILGITSYIGVILLKEKFRIDDALDVSVLHGLTGIIGSISIGFAASGNGVYGWIAGRPIQILFQLIGVGMAIIWSAFWSGLILFAMKKTIGIRVSRTAEEQGLDQVEHGEEIDLYLHKQHKSSISTVSDNEYIPIKRLSS